MRKMSRFYVATSLARAAEALEVASQMTARGFTLTHNWMAVDPAEDAADLKKAGENDAQGVKSADLLIVLLPCGLGAHVEFGIALALRTNILLCYTADSDFLGPYNYKCAFHYNTGVIHLKYASKTEIITAAEKLLSIP